MVKRAARELCGICVSKLLEPNMLCGG